MKFAKLPIPGAYEVTREPHEDERGSFTRVWSSADFGRAGLAPALAESSLSFSARRRTLRGLHYQVAPHEEAKLVTCLRGSLWDVLLDMRPGSATYGTWCGQTLDAAGLTSIYVPEGVAHGLLTLTDDVLVLYQISGVHDVASSVGVRWDDPQFAIDWPMTPAVISPRDGAFSDVRVDPPGSAASPRPEREPLDEAVE